MDHNWRRLTFEVPAATATPKQWATGSFPGEQQQNRNIPTEVASITAAAGIIKRDADELDAEIKRKYEEPGMPLPKKTHVYTAKIPESTLKQECRWVESSDKVDRDIKHSDTASNNEGIVKVELAEMTHDAFRSVVVKQETPFIKQEQL